MIEQKKPRDFTLVYKLLQSDEWRNEAAERLRYLANQLESGLTTDVMIELMRLNQPKEQCGWLMFSITDESDDEGDHDLSLDDLSLDDLLDGDIEPISQQEFANALSHVVLTPTEDGDAMILSLPKKHQSKGGE